VESKTIKNRREKYKSIKTAHVTIVGRVHGVGFRQFLKSNAKSLGLVGWAQNNEDRTVEAMFQSSANASDQEGEEAIKKMIELCHVGPMLSEVRNVSVSWLSEQFPYTDFEVL
jgi:acylphosphatase